MFVRSSPNVPSSFPTVPRDSDQLFNPRVVSELCSRQPAALDQNLMRLQVLIPPAGLDVTRLSSQPDLTSWNVELVKTETLHQNGNFSVTDGLSIGMSRSGFFYPDPDPSPLILSICRYRVPL